MTVLVFLVLAVAAVTYMTIPLLWERFWPFLEHSSVAEIQRAKRESLWAVSDVENEHDMGKITDKDYQELRGRMKGELLEVLNKERQVMGNVRSKEIDELPPSLKKDLLFEVLRICGLRRQ